MSSADSESPTQRRGGIIPPPRPMGSATMVRRGGVVAPSPDRLEALQHLAQGGGTQPHARHSPDDDVTEGSVTSGTVFSGAHVELEDQLTNEKLRELELIFEEADEDGGGGLDMDEFKTAMRKAMGGNLTDNELDQLFMKVDTNCDGTVDWDEYLSYMLLEYREKDQMNMDAQKKPFPKRVKKVHKMRMFHRHSDALIRVTMTPTVKKVNNVLYQSTADGSGRYVTVSKDGIINFWTLELRHLRNLKVEKLRPTLNQQIGVWVTDLVYLPNVNLLAVSTTASDVIFYSTMHNKMAPARCIVDNEICFTCMDYWVNPANPGHSVLYLGDARGNVYGLTFRLCDVACFFNPSQHTSQLAVKMADVLAGKVCCVSGVFLPRVHNDFVLKIKYVPELQSFLSCCRDRATSVFLGDLRQLKKTYFRVRKGIFDFAYCSKNNVIVTGGKDTIVRVWNPYVCAKPVILLHGHKSAVIHVIVNEREEHVVSISEDKDINVFDMATQVCVQTIHRQWLNIGPRPISAVFFNQRRQSLIVGTNELAFLEHEEGEVMIHQLTSHTSPANVIIYNELFDQLITGSTDSLVCVWDIKSGKKLMQFYAHKKTQVGQDVTEDITAMKLDPTQRRLATAARDGIVRIWNFNNGALLRELETYDQKEVTSIVWERGRIITAGWNRRLTVYVDSPDDDTVTHFKCRHYEDILGLAFVPPATIISASFDGDILCWALDTGRLMYRFNAKTGDKTLIADKPSGKNKFAASAGILKRTAELRKKSLLPGPTMSGAGGSGSNVASGGSGRRLHARRASNRGTGGAGGVGVRRESLQVPGAGVGVGGRRRSVSPRKGSVSPRRGSRLPSLPPTSSPHALSLPGAITEEEEGKGDGARRGKTVRVTACGDAPGDPVPQTPTLTAEDREKCLATLARLVRRRQSMRQPRDRGLALMMGAQDTSVDRLLVLQTRGQDRDTACLVAAGAAGWIRFWSVHPDSGLLGEFKATHNEGDDVVAMTTDTRNHYLITGDSSGYVKIWFIELYCIDTTESSDSDTWIPRRPDGIPSDLERSFPFLCVTQQARDKHCPHKGIHPCRGPNSQLCGAPPLLNSFRGHLQPISCVDYIDSREYIVTSSSDCSVRLWSLQGEFIGIFGQDVPWERTTQEPTPSTPSISASADSAASGGPDSSSEDEDEGKTFAERFSNLKSAAAERKLPADVKKVASATTMRVLYGGVRPHWKLAKNIVLVWIPMLRNTRRPLQLADLMAEAEARANFDPGSGQSFTRVDGKCTNILGMNFRTGRKHQPLPKLGDIRTFHNQVDVFSSLPCHDLSKIEIRCTTPQIVRDARESSKALERHRRLASNMNKAKHLARLMKMPRGFTPKVPLGKKQSNNMQRHRKSISGTESRTDTASPLE